MENIFQHNKHIEAHAGFVIWCIDFSAGNSHTHSAVEKCWLAGKIMPKMVEM